MWTVRIDRSVAWHEISPTPSNYFESLTVMPSSDQIRAKLGLGPRPKPLFGHNRSHALNATRKIWKPNVQNKWVTIDGQRYRVKLTAREMRTLDKKGISLSSL